MSEMVGGEQCSWSRRRTLFAGVVVVALTFAVGGIVINSSTISHQIPLLRISAASSLRVARSPVASTPDRPDEISASAGSIATTSSSIQVDERPAVSIDDRDQHTSSSNQRDENVATKSMTTSEDNRSALRSQQTTSSTGQQGEVGASQVASGPIDSPQPLSGDGTTIETSSLQESASAFENPSLSASGSHYTREEKMQSASNAQLDDTSATSTSATEAPSTDSTPQAIHVPLMVPGFETPIRDPDLPPAVHALWIGDIDSAPEELGRYRKAGFDLTIHNDVDSILDGFAPHVRLAYTLAIPRVAGFDLLKFLLLYKYGGLVVDADTFPNVSPSHMQYASDCKVLFGKETHLTSRQFSQPTYRRAGGNSYGFARPYQLLNWAMLAREPRNPHIAALIDGAMRHFYGMRDVDENFVQDVAGSGLMSDYVALVYGQHGESYVAAFKAHTPPMSLQAVDGLCLLEDELRDNWIHHDFHGTWKGFNG